MENLRVPHYFYTLWYLRAIEGTLLRRGPSGLGLGGVLLPESVASGPQTPW